MSFCIICRDDTETEPMKKCSKGHTVHESCFMEWIVYKNLIEKKCLICGEKIETIWKEICGKLGDLLFSVFIAGTIVFPIWFYTDDLD